MKSLLVDERDQMFVLYEMLGIEELCNYQAHTEHSRELFDMVLTECGRLATGELMPVDKEGDQIGCTYYPENHTVEVPSCYKAAYEKLGEGGWISMCETPEVGGEGFPLTIGAAVSEVFYAACFPVYGGAILGHGAGKLVELFGDDKQKRKYLGKLYSGRWGGTMCLTEADAGSDVGALRTSATENSDGSYSIKGTKLFITGGEQDLTENIVHMVLARIDGDPPGTKGLSVFIVPKILVKEDGTLGSRNDVIASGIEHKMGQHGLVTATLNFGENGGCIGYLLGERSKGIRVMFHMMNEQRLLIGVQGLAMASKAFLNSVSFAKTRIQGVPVSQLSDKDRTPGPIIQHPDIRRMLLLMKAYVEGCRAMTYFSYYCIDQTNVAVGEEKVKWQGLVGLMTPIVKAYNSYKAWEISGMAIECAGGYGYCSEYPFEKIARDCKVTSIYEGTNGIQAIDLIVRKLMRNKLADFEVLISEMDKTIEKGKQIAGIESYTEILEKAKKSLVKVVFEQMRMVNEGKQLPIYYNATPLLNAMGDVLLGWMHLWQLTISCPRLRNIIGEKRGNEREKMLKASGEAAFYHGKVLVSQYYIGSVLRETFGKFDRIMSKENAVFEMYEESFV